MLSDALHHMRERFSSGTIGDDFHGLVLQLRAYEIEARNMENRIAVLSGRPHVALDGRLVAVEIGGER